MRNLFLFILIYVLSTNACAQEESSFNGDDSVAYGAIAVYPANVRTNILESAVYPQSLLKIQELQKRTSKSYKNLLSDYFKNEQEKFWELSRHEGLIEKMVKGGPKTKEELTLIAADYPKDIRETIVNYGKRFYTDLEEINKLNKKAEIEFDGIIKQYPPVTQNALKELTKHPEVIGILCNNMRVTVMLGDMYKNKKDYLNAKLDSISLVQADRKAKEIEEWKSGLENNPEAKKEMLDAAKEFSKDQGKIKEEDIDNDVDVNFIVAPYPYWFGYPWWYNYPYWYPRPYWYDWGFYVGPAGFVYLGLPSPFFTYWYFSYHPHHYYYNHFSDYCISHYYGHRNIHGGFNKEMRNWTRKNEVALPRGYLNNDPKRPERLKELGKFEIDYKNTIKQSGKKISREEYQKNKGQNYPSINKGKPGVIKPVPSRPKPNISPPRSKPLNVPHSQPPANRGGKK